MVATTRPETDERDNDLAAELTDFTLAGLARAGVRGDSVALELALWRALTNAISREALWNGGLPPDGVLAQIVHRAALVVAADFTPRHDLIEVARRLRSWATGLHITARQRGLLAERTARAGRGWDRADGESGAFQALRVSALG
jgi:hypothetical protein